MKTKKPLHYSDLNELRSILQEKTGYLLKKYLVEQAFTRSSYSKQYGGGSNENFEFIGDTILGYHTVHKLYEHYGTIHSDEEGCFYSFWAYEKDFTALKSTIVSNKTLAKIIDGWNVIRFLIVGKSDIDNEVDKQEKIKADLLEAIIGAYAVQYNWSTTVMEKIIERVLPVGQFIEEYESSRYRELQLSAENAVNTLKELAEHEKCSFPTYVFSGPDSLGNSKSGKPLWCCSCTVTSFRTRIMVFAHTKKDAKKYASYMVLCRVYEMPNEYGPNKHIDLWYFDGKHLTPNESEEF